MSIRVIERRTAFNLSRPILKPGLDLIFASDFQKLRKTKSSQNIFGYFSDNCAFGQQFKPYGVDKNILQILVQHVFQGFACIIRSKVLSNEVYFLRSGRYGAQNVGHTLESYVSLCSYGRYYIHLQIKYFD